MTELAPGIPVRSYTRTLRARWMWLVIGALLGLGGSTGFLLLSPTQYTATAVVNVEVVSTTPFRADRPASNVIDMGTEASLAGSYSTAVLAAKRLGGGWDANEMRTSTEVTADANGTIMRFQFTAEDPLRAREGADGVAKAYLTLRRDQAVERASQTTAAIDDRLAMLTVSLRTALVEIASTEPGSTARGSAEADAALMRSEIDALVSERSSLINLSSHAGQLITPAEATTLAVAPSQRLALSAGLLGGIVLGIVMAFVRERLTRGVGTGQALGSLVTVPIWFPDDDNPRDPWGTARGLFAYAVAERQVVSVIILGDDKASEAVAHQIAASAKEAPGSAAINLVEQGSTRAEILNGVRGSDSAVLVMPPSYRKSSLLALLALLDEVNLDVLGITVSRDLPGNQAPLPRAERSPRYGEIKGLVVSSSGSDGPTNR